MKIARSTLKANLRTPPAFSMGQDEIEARNLRQDALNILSGFGCGDCTGLSPIFNGEFSCPLFEAGNAEKLTEDQRKLALDCGVPGLYARVLAGTLSPAEVTQETAVRACPFLTWEEG